MYNKVDTNLNFVEREQQIEKFWEDHDIFKKQAHQHEDADVFTFYDGPPTANGKPHIGHVLTRVIKDMIPRYQAMKGHKALRKAGWDTHGLPVELEVEKVLGINGKEQIEEYGIEPFVEKCKESVWKYEGMWEEFSKAVGFWADMKDPYVTYHNDYIESVWWALSEIWKKGLLYKGHKIVPYCPRCGTPLSSHEVAQGYKEVKEKSAFVRFKVKGEDAYFLAWTTTPWTLPSNLALCVNPEIEYVKVQQGEYTYYMAKELCEKVLGEEFTILESFTGKDLEYKEYEPLWDFAVDKLHGKKAFIVTCDDYVTTTDGTGVVHMAPAFGEDDSRVCQKYDIGFVQFVDAQGCLTKETLWPGVFVKKADPKILTNLEERGLLFSAPVFEHSYPHCWRCDTPLLYYARESWFIRMTAVRDRLIANNNTINWIPESIGKGRFGDWIEHVQDWGLSRNRYWGTPLNVWECECGHQHAIGSIAELKEMSDNCPDNIELHRPFIDEVTIKCSQCGKQMHRVPEVIDCWFDSGSMPFAQWHYPFENKELFEEQFPADFISEAVDQTRGWFYSLLAISTLLFDKAPYKNVIVLGHVLDAQGRKMSKSKGNAVEPMKALAQHGADAIRWYFYENSAPWLPNRFHDAAVQEGQRKFMGTLWNTYAFFVLYANIDKFNVADYQLEYAKLNDLDKWCLSRLNTVMKTVDECLESYKITEAAHALQDFLDELSNWYVRRSRERFWAKEINQDKINAYLTLYTALTTLIKLAAPMIPFITESIYQNLVLNTEKDAPESIHLCDYPVVHEEFIDTELEKTMDLVLKAVALGRAARNEANIKNRQPIAMMYIKAPFQLNDYYTHIVEEELNVKQVEFKDDMSGYLNYEIKPQFKLLGPKVGKLMKEVASALASLDGRQAKEELDRNKQLVLHLADDNIILEPADVDIVLKQTEGFVAQSNGPVIVAISTVLTPELIEEGFVREIISKVQTMRKENGFEVTDKIKVSFSGNETIASIASANADTIKAVTLSTELVVNATSSIAKEWNINGEKVTISIEKA